VRFKTQETTNHLQVKADGCEEGKEAHGEEEK
jgi:hypothetical protein